MQNALTNKTVPSMHAVLVIVHISYKTIVVVTLSVRKESKIVPYHLTVVVIVNFSPSILPNAMSAGFQQVSCLL